MSGSLKNKLLRFETAPPPGVWEHISNELDKEFISSDTVVSSRLENIAIDPPGNAWREIESILDNERKPTDKVKVIPLIYKRLAVAVIAIALVAITVMYLYTGGENNSPEVAYLVKNNPDIKTENSVILPVPSPAASISVRPFSASAGIIENKQLYVTQASFVSEPETSKDITEVHFADLRTVDTEQAINIPSRSIRDSCGDIIMDMKLISKPNDPYITVTGPNGSQTRISSKFLSCLSYLNGDASDDDGLIWKDKFQSWREKLLSENSFVPTAGNFFDIFEMKDIIQE